MASNGTISVKIPNDAYRKLQRIAPKERRKMGESIAFYADARYFELFGTDELPEENTSAVPTAAAVEVEDD